MVFLYFCALYVIHIHIIININQNTTMNKKLHYLLLLLAAIVGMTAAAAVPSGYYNNAKNKSDRALMAALHSIIDGHTKRSYDQLKVDFKTTDCNGNIIIDRYSNSQFSYSTDFCGTYNGVGDCYNREHSIPNSWWGGSDSDTAYTDLHHLFPVDGFVNSKRGNNPFGDCNTGTVYGTGKLGSCTFSGYNGTVFEVADEYKGDFARVYFYFATRYMTRMSDYTSGTGNVVFTASTYLGLTNWAINQLLEWHHNDPVSTLETTRNDAVYGIQHNRNPFVDYPELVEYIWGNKKGSVWNPSGTPTPTLTSPTSGSTVNVGTHTGEGVSKTITVKGANLTKALTISVSGTGFSVTPTSITAANANNGTSVTVTYNGTQSNATGTLTINSTEVNATVNLTASYRSGGGQADEEIVETWEGCETGGYWTQEVQGAAFKWDFNNAGLYARESDHWNGSLGCCFGKNANSSITMNEDVYNGASKITFYAAKYGNDANATLQVQYSTNGGSTWTTLNTCALNGTWQQYTFNLDVTGSVRFKFQQTAGARLNIDDIAITSNPSAPVEPTIAITSIAAMEAEQDGTSTIVTGTVTAEDNTDDITLTVEGNFELSLNRQDWARSLSLDPSGEVFYVRLANTSAVGNFYGSITATTGRVSAYADVQGTVNAKPTMIGDVNKDGSVNIADVTALIDYLLNNDGSSIDLEAANVTQDGDINIADVTALIDRLLSSPSSLRASGWDAYPAVGGIAIENHTGESLEVYDLDANCCAVIVSQGESHLDLPAGIYIVASEQSSRKVVVK
jgi:endonuclease I